MMSRLKEVSDKGTRQAMYKMRSPSWKESYRNRCIERLRENRSKCQARMRKMTDEESKSAMTDTEIDSDPVTVPVIDFRGESCKTYDRNSNCTNGNDEFRARCSSGLLSIEEIMEEEWRRMNAEMAEDREPSDTSSNNIHNDVEDMIHLYEQVCSELKQEIQQDLQREEAILLKQQEIYETELQRQEEELCLAVKALSTDEVICPLCEKSSLMENKGIILCSCGLRIDTEQDCISLSQIKANLSAATSEHSKSCEDKPEFSLSHKFGITNIVMTCQVCDFLFIIL